MAQIIKNNVSGVLASGIGSGATSMSLVDASDFPAPTGEDFFLATLIGVNSNAQESSWEIVKVTARSGNTLTIQRGQESTTAATWASGTRVEMRLTAGSISTMLEPAIAAGTTSQYLRGDKTWRDFFTDVRAATLTGLSTATNSVITATDTVLSALGKLQKQVSDNLTTLTTHTGNTSNPHSTTAAQVGAEPAITSGTTSQFWRGDKTWQDLFGQVRAATLTGLSTATNAVITASDTVLSALGKLQKQVSDNLATLSNHTGNTSNPHSTTAAQVGAVPASGGDFTGAVAVSVNSSSDAMRITQAGTGNALVVEDSTSPDSSPFVIDANGNVVSGHTSALAGVGLTPTVQTVGGTTGDANTLGRFRYSANSGGLLYDTYKSRSATIGSHTAVASGDDLAQFRFFGSDGASFVQAADILAEVDATPAAGSMPGRLVFSTTPSGSGTPVEAMRIDSSQQVGIGATPSAGRSVSIGKNTTGGVNGLAVAITPTTLSDVTTASYGVFTALATQAASFTLGSMQHYAATQGAFGAGSTVTNQYGFHAFSNLTGATNNYGFYSNIAAGTGRWNFYANGTAANYFAGNVGVGSNVASNKLDVRNGQALFTRSSLGGPITAPAAAEISLLSNVSTVSTGTQQITFHSDRQDRWSAIGHYRDTVSGRIGLSFFTSNDEATPTERMRLTHTGDLQVLAGNVGIAGVTSPSHALHIGGGERIRINATSGAGYADYLCGLTNGGASIRGSGGNDVSSVIDLDFPDVSTNSSNVRIGRATNTSGLVTFDVYACNGTSAVRHRLESDGDALLANGVGNVGIGGAPDQKLHVYGTLKVQNTSTPTSNHGYFLSNTNATADYGFGIVHVNNGVVDASISVGGNATGGSVGTLIFATNSSGGAATEKARIDASGNLVSTGGGSVGYGAGSGGTVTQATSRTTGVTINKPAGAITLASAAGSTAWQSFTVTNSTVTANDVVHVCQKSGTDLYEIHVTAVAAGSFRVSFRTTGGTTTEQPVFNFAVIRGATA